MEFSTLKAIGLAAALSFLSPPVFADPCIDAINKFNAGANRFNQLLGGKKLGMSSETECRSTVATIETVIPVVQDQIGALAAMRGTCGSRAKDMHTGVNPDAILSKLTTSMNWCKEQLAKVDRSAPPAAAAPSTVERPAPPAPRPTARGSADCSTITDSSHPGGGPCPPHRGQLRCQGATGFTGCLQASGWTAKQPYNHGSTPMIFKPFRGTEIRIDPGQSLWSIPQGDSRSLVGGPWDGNGDDRVETEPQNIDETKCAQKDTNANTRKFQVSIVCEMRRQLLEQSEFEHREDGYLDPTLCKGKIRLLPDYEKKTPLYWLEHPSEPVGYCDEEDRRSSTVRTNSRPIREPRWLTPDECAALPTQKATPVLYNARGIRGCKQVFQ